jgi:hypothetical protein
MENFILRKEKPVDYPIKDMLINQQYQRSISMSRVNRIIDEIKKYGLLDTVITLNQDGEIVDGQHRWSAATKLGISTWKASVYHFAGLEAQAKFFSDINNWNNRLKTADIWHSRYIAECPYANLLYALNDREASVLYTRIPLRKNVRQDKDKLIPISAITTTLNFVCLDVKCVWKLSNDATLVKRASNADVTNVILLMNEYFKNFIFKISDNKLPSDYYRALAIFYDILSRENLIQNRREINKLVESTKRAVFEPSFAKSSLKGRICSLALEYNSKRRNNRLDEHILFKYTNKLD